MQIDTEFKFEIWQRGIWDLLRGESSYFNPRTQTIAIYYHKWLNNPKIAFKTVVSDVNHESIHSILMQLINKQTSMQYDNIATKIQEYCYTDYKEITETFKEATKKVKEQCKQIE